MADARTSRIVYPGPDGKLVYVADDRGNRIPDFSHAGYLGGGVALPEAPVRETVAPGDGDDGARIQAAIDRVSRLAADARGLRGAVLLKKGRYQIGDHLAIRVGGVVLRGEGQGEDGTVLEAVGAKKRSLIVIAPAGDAPRHLEVPHTRQPITDAYVPVGAQSVSVADASGFRVGQTVIVHRPSTQAWISALGMDRIPPRRDGGTVRQWTPGHMDIRYNRVITAIDGNRLVLDAPIFQALDREDATASVYAYDDRDIIGQIGVENMRSVSAFVGPTDEDHAWTMVSFDHVWNAWVRNVTAVHYGYATVHTGDETKWITVQDCECLDLISRITGSRRYPFSMHGQLHLVQRCYAREGRHDFAAGTTRSSGIVFLDCTSEHIHASSEPHHRYSTGILYDNVHFKNPDTQLVLALWNRLNYGTGHGWAAANSVLWNCTAPEGGIACEKPPLAQNYAIGCASKWMSSNMRWGDDPGLKTEFTPGSAHWEFWNAGPVTPRSLYLAQLADRLGHP